MCLLFISNYFLVIRVFQFFQIITIYLINYLFNSVIQFILFLFFNLSQIRIIH